VPSPAATPSPLAPHPSLLHGTTAATRMKQMEDRALTAAVERERDAAQVAVWRAEQEAAAARERERVEARRRAAETSAAGLRAQMAERAAADAAAKQAAYLEWKAAQKAEREYAARVDTMLRAM